VESNAAVARLPGVSDGEFGITWGGWRVGRGAKPSKATRVAFWANHDPAPAIRARHPPRSRSGRGNCSLLVELASYQYGKLRERKSLAAQPIIYSNPPSFLS